MLRKYWSPAVKIATGGPKAVTPKCLIRKESGKEDSESDQSSGSDCGEDNSSDETGDTDSMQVKRNQQIK